MDCDYCIFKSLRNVYECYGYCPYDVDYDKASTSMFDFDHD